MTDLIGAAFGRPCSTSFLRPLSIIQVWSFDVSRMLDPPTCLFWFTSAGPHNTFRMRKPCFTPGLRSQEIATILGDRPMNRSILIALRPIFSKFLVLLEARYHARIGRRQKAVHCFMKPKDTVIWAGTRGRLVAFIPKRKLPTDLQLFQRCFLLRGASIIFRILTVNKASSDHMCPDLFRYTGCHLARSQDLRDSFYPGTSLWYHTYVVVRTCVTGRPSCPPASLGTACTPRVYEEVERNRPTSLRSPSHTKPAHQHPPPVFAHRLSLHSMDFFLNLFFGPATTEARADLDTEVEQVPVDFEGEGGQNGGCVVA